MDVGASLRKQYGVSRAQMAIAHRRKQIAVVITGWLYIAYEYQIHGRLFGVALTGAA